VAGLCRPEANEFAGSGLKGLCQTLGIPPVLSYGTCTDTGRIADLLASLSGALGNVPVSELPVAAVAPEYMEQKATIDAIFALAFGLYTYVNPVPTITGAPNLVHLLTQDCKQLTGGILSVEKNPSRLRMPSWPTSKRIEESWAYRLSIGKRTYKKLLADRSPVL
jgi:carbon-monoxide dehydrogenase catalytic subunit